MRGILAAGTNRFTGIVDAGNPVPTLVSTYGLSGIPDGIFSWYEVSGTIYVFITAGSTNSTYGFTTPSFGPNSFVIFNPLFLSGGNALPLIGPAGGTTAPDSAYLGLAGSVPDPADPSALLWFCHAENHSHWAGGGSSATIVSITLTTQPGIGYAGPLTRQGVVIAGQMPLPVAPPARTICNVGLPNVVVTGGFIYIFFTDWMDGALGPHVEQINVARAPLASRGVPGSFFKWYNGAWSQDALSVGPATNIIAQPPGTGGLVCPSVSYNASLGQWVMFFGTTLGYHYTLSTDLVTWSPPVLLFAYNGPLGLSSPLMVLRSPGLPYGQTNGTLFAHYLQFSTGTQLAYMRSLTLN